MPDDANTSATDPMTDPAADPAVDPNLSSSDQSSDEPLDLTEFEWRLQVRPIHMDDFDQIVDMQAKAFPGMKTWTR